MAGPLAKPGISSTSCPPAARDSLLVTLSREEENAAAESVAASASAAIAGPKVNSPAPQPSTARRFIAKGWGKISVESAIKCAFPSIRLILGVKFRKLTEYLNRSSHILFLWREKSPHIVRGITWLAHYERAVNQGREIYGGAFG